MGKHLFMCENHSTSGPQPRQKGVLEIADVARLVASPEIGRGMQLDGLSFVVPFLEFNLHELDISKMVVVPRKYL